MNTYVYDGSYLYYLETQHDLDAPEDSEAYEGYNELRVTPMTEVCHNVERKSFPRYTEYHFQVQGRGDTWFKTRSALQLILNTPENLEAVKARNVLYEELDALGRKVKQAESKVLNVRVEQLIQLGVKL